MDRNKNYVSTLSNSIIILLLVKMLDWVENREVFIFALQITDYNFESNVKPVWMH